MVRYLRKYLQKHDWSIHIPDMFNLYADWTCAVKY